MVTRNNNQTGNIYPKWRVKNKGENNPSWKGDNVSYRNLHCWVNRNLQKPELCQECHKKPPLDLSNITGIYNRDFSNWKYLCRRCHMLSDGRMNNLKQFQ